MVKFNRIEGKSAKEEDLARKPHQDRVWPMQKKEIRKETDPSCQDYCVAQCIRKIGEGAYPATVTRWEYRAFTGWRSTSYRKQ